MFKFSTESLLEAVTARYHKGPLSQMAAIAV